MSTEDLDAADRMRAILDAGLAPEQLAELGRTIAVAMSQFAAASRQVVGDTFVGDGGAEDEVADRVAEGAGGADPARRARRSTTSIAAPSRAASP